MPHERKTEAFTLSFEGRKVRGSRRARLQPGPVMHDRIHAYHVPKGANAEPSRRSPFSGCPTLAVGGWVLGFSSSNIIAAAATDSVPGAPSCFLRVGLGVLFVRPAPHPACTRYGAPGQNAFPAVNSLPNSPFPIETDAFLIATALRRTAPRACEGAGCQCGGQRGVRFIRDRADDDRAARVGYSGGC